MTRRTLSLPENVEALLEKHRQAGESVSATAVRLIRAGADATSGKEKPRYVASGEGPEDLGLKAEKYLRDLVTAR